LSGRSPSAAGVTPFATALPSLADLRAARERAAAHAIRTPLVRLPAWPGEREIWLKLECLQPIGSFKIRGATNALALASRDALAAGVTTASAGNMAQGVAWAARALGVRCTVLAPDHAPAAKLEAIARLGADVVKVPFARWWQAFEERSFPGLEGLFVHPVSDEAVIAGNAGVGLEILEDLPDVTAVLVPFGGGGLSCGIAAALRAAGSRAGTYGCEVATAAPLAASFAAGAASAIEYQPSFVDGIGGRAVLPEMWPLVRQLLAGACVSSPEQVAAAIRALVTRAHVVAEGAGGASLAAALGDGVVTGGEGSPAKLPDGPLVCVISGGNIDPAKLAVILEGRVP
jgi:threonine dehydratase